jgi:hypothetical protein
MTQCGNQPRHLIAEERALAAFAEELMPVVKDRMKAWLVSGGHVPENLWWL